MGLTNKDPTLKKLQIGAGWDVTSLEGDPPDLDLSCFMLDKTEKTRMDEDFVFYNNPKSLDGEIIHLGDSRTGAGEGDDEGMEMILTGISFDIQKIILVLSIHDGDIRDHDFSMVDDVFIRLVNKDSGLELVRYDIPNAFLHDHAKAGTAFKIGVMVRDGAKWRFQAGTEFVKGGLSKIGKEYGLLIV